MSAIGPRPVANVTAGPWAAGGTDGPGGRPPVTEMAGSVGMPANGAGTAAASGSTPGGAASFLDAIGAAAGRLNGDLRSADAAMASFAAGGSADLHAVVLQMQEASLQLKVGVQVRDRLLEAYQDIMRLQV